MNISRRMYERITKHYHECCYLIDVFSSKSGTKAMHDCMLQCKASRPTKYARCLVVENFAEGFSHGNKHEGSPQAGRPAIELAGMDQGCVTAYLLGIHCGMQHYIAARPVPNPEVDQMQDTLEEAFQMMRARNRADLEASR